MPLTTDIRPVAATLYLLPVETRVPLKFGPETLTHVTCARVSLTVRDRAGRTATGWGETPLSVQWAWPATIPYRERFDAMRDLCVTLTAAWSNFDAWGHPIELGHDFVEGPLHDVLASLNARRPPEARIPWLAGLICASAFDIALHDAYGQLHQRPVYDLYSRAHLSRDLGAFLEPARDGLSFAGQYPSEYLSDTPPRELAAWHLVGGLDPLEAADLTGAEPGDGHPLLLRDWIDRDGLRYLKIKLRGNDAAWDLDRLRKVGRIALERDVTALSADFNCTVREPAYVNEILDCLRADEAAIFERILYVEQPFPYELESHRIDVHSVAKRKPLFLDESAHDWRLVRLGRELGWTGVALKTCKTQTGALLTACWAKAHGLSLMVQDLTNPMLAMIPHVELAARVGTIAGVEVNAMQFYPEASVPEERVHPGLYRRRNGALDLSTIQGSGFGYRLDEIKRELPAPAARHQG